MNVVAPELVVLSGSLSAESRTGRLGRWSARLCVERGAVVTCFDGRDLEFPLYSPDRSDRSDALRRYLGAMRRSDAVVLISPAYHGALSGVLKNALDYLNDLAGEQRPFLDGRVIGCVTVASGEQGAVSALSTMRMVGHALRGWPTPLGIALAGERAAVAADGAPGDPAVRLQFSVLVDQVLRMTARNYWPDTGIVQEAGSDGRDRAVAAAWLTPGDRGSR